MEPDSQLQILYQDRWLVAVHKPAGLLVHRTALAAGQTEQFALQMVRDQVGQYVYPIHRLDRPTSGVLLFAFDDETTRSLRETFTTHQIEKEYLTVVRGYTAESGVIDYPLIKWADRKVMKKKKAQLAEGEELERQAAVTHYERLATAEIPIPVGRYSSSRYSLVKAMPQTGRTHQIRRHFNHIAHPIVGDHRYGDNQHNKMFRIELGLTDLFLFAWQLAFAHPRTGEMIQIKSAVEPMWHLAADRLGWTAVFQEILGL